PPPSRSSRAIGGRAAAAARGPPPLPGGGGPRRGAGAGGCVPTARGRPGIRPLEALELFASYYDEPDDPERLLDVVGLREAEHTLVRRMSGGQYQRAALALALIGRAA